MEHNKDIDKLFHSLKGYSLPEEKSNWDLMAYLLKSSAKKILLKKIMQVAAIVLFGLFVMAGGTWVVIRYNHHTDKPQKQQKESRFNENKEADSTEEKLVLLSKKYQQDSTMYDKQKRYLPPFMKPPTTDTFEFPATSEQKGNTKSGMLVKTKIVKSYYKLGGNKGVKIQINRLPNINSSFLDFGSVIVMDGTRLYFTSNKPVTEKDKRKNRGGLSNVFYSEFIQSKGIWTTPKQLPAPINLPKHNNSVIGLSGDGQKMFLYRDKKGKGTIYVSHLQGLSWGEPKELPAPINSPYNEFSVALSPDGNKMFFVSDRPGGVGGKDIWCATKNEVGKWSNARNIRNINTSKDEAAVFLASDGKTMYFSSKGYAGFGGYDIYKSTFKNGRWSQPVNIGKSINTEGDDIYFVLEANGTTGYYTSRLPGEIRNTDLYKISFVPEDGNKSSLAKLTLFKCKVVDEKTGAPLRAEVVVTNLQTNEVITKTSTNSATGKMLVTLPAGIDYGITVSKPGYTFYSKNINAVKDSVFKKIEQVVSLTKLEKGSHVILHNVFFDFGKATLRTKSYTELNRLIELLKEYPTMKIEIGGHTDSKGSKGFNLKLSQDRAESVKRYLISNGVSPSRLSSKGYGASEPIAPNTFQDGSDNPAGRQKNRRVEFVVLSN